MSIGIISAMREEIQALHNHLELRSTVEKGRRTYYQGKMFNQEVVLVFSRWGKVASATTVTQLINDFEIDEIIFTGVAGGLKNKIKIGDIVIGKKLYQHDMDASPLIPKYEIPLLGKRAFQTDLIRTESLYIAAQKFITQIDVYLSREVLNVFQINQPQIHLGDIASGDQFISDKVDRAQIKKGLPEVLCVEMEGAAVAQVCFEYKVPFTIIRTISDNSNDNSHLDFPKFAKEIASEYALGILKNYFEKE
jgi:adenosylhomocysteine nucleosidase